MKLLLDIDGTLCKSRQKISEDMLIELKRLCNKYEVGLITGSHKDYIIEQLNGFIHPNLVLMPCNGTQTWTWRSDGTWELDEEVRISDKVEVQALVAEIEKVFQTMKPTLTQFGEPEGERIQVRASLINFCPIGRSSLPERRARFEEFDKINLFRKDWLPELKKVASKYGCIAGFGGATSFDIYPIGWNKLFGLEKFRSTIKENDIPLVAEGVLYVGNSFFEDGNDSCMLSSRDVVCIVVNDPPETLNVLKHLR